MILGAGAWQVKPHRIAVWSFLLLPTLRDSWPAPAFPLGLAYPRAPHSRRRAAHGNNAVAPTARATRLSVTFSPATRPGDLTIVVCQDVLCGHSDMARMTGCGSTGHQNTHRQPTPAPLRPPFPPLHQPLSTVILCHIGTLARYMLGVPPGHCFPCRETIVPVEAGLARKPLELCYSPLITRHSARATPREMASSVPES